MGDQRKNRKIEDKMSLRTRNDCVMEGELQFFGSPLLEFWCLIIYNYFARTRHQNSGNSDITIIHILYIIFYT